ncbi:hypothetical protein RvY_04663 [Ramazzottius varieornatus]|uniref:ENTH domain-containing protein n=1 Tax=Ramazzottius varieornatus TaxID=947166 RepID=A0A1D1USF0_RAMVA|nr:hypothetical protein RvY_04663 [Ramazzottius varieornatus]
MWKIRELTDQVVNMVMNYTEVEAKVREATNEDPWGPTGPQMQELSQMTYSGEHYHEVMSMLWKRMLIDNKANWRRVYKSLLLLGYLLRNGAERVVTSGKEHMFDLKSLEHYKFIDEVGKDQGLNVRNRVKEIVDLLQDDQRLRDERKKARKTKDKYIGLSADEASMRRGGGGYSGGGGSNRKSWSPSDSPSAARKNYDSDPEDNGDPAYEFHDDNGGADSDGGTRSHRKAPVKQLKPIGRKIEDKPDSVRTKTPTGVEAKVDNRPRSVSSVGNKDLLTADFGEDVGRVSPAGAGPKAASASHSAEDWADFASARTEGNAAPKNDSSPDDFIEGLTKINFTKSFKGTPAPPGSKDLDLLNNDFGEFATAAPTQPSAAAFTVPGQTSAVPAFGMSHSATLPSMSGGIRPAGFPPQMNSGFQAQPLPAAASNVNALNMLSMPQSQSMTFAPHPSGAHWNIPQQTMIRPGSNAPNYSSATMCLSYGVPAQSAQARGTGLASPVAPASMAGKTAQDWTKGSGLNIDLDLSLAKQYAKPLSPPMNQLQATTLVGQVGSGTSRPTSANKQGVFGASNVSAPPSNWSASQSGVAHKEFLPDFDAFSSPSTSSSSQQQHAATPFGDLLQ